MTRRFRSNLFRQGGAIGILGVVTLMLALLFTALVVDSGRLWMQKRHLQTVADIASIQAARQMGCAWTLGSITTAAQAAAAANGFDGNLANSPNVVEVVDIATNASGVRVYTSAGSGAVRVYATRTVPASLIVGGLIGNTVTLHAEAVSRADPAIAAFSAGSFAASIDTEDSVLLNALLGNVLGSAVDLDLVSYQGIAATNVTLNDLLTASGQVGGLDSLLTTSLGLNDLLSLYALAVSNSGTADVDAVAGMQELASVAANTTSLTLGQVLNVTTPDAEAAGKVGVNLMSLLTTTVLIANGNNAISMPLGVTVPGVASVTGQINVIQPPQMVIGPAGDGVTMCTTLETAQVSAEVGTVVSVLGVELNLGLSAEVADGSAGLGTVTTSGDKTNVTIQASPGIASLSLHKFNDTSPATIRLAGLPIANLTLDLPVQPAAAQDVVFYVTHPVADNLPQTQTVSSPLGDSLANAMTGGVINVDPLGLGGILNAALINTVVSSVVTPLLQQMANAFLDPLLEMLGIRLGGMDITLEGVQMRQEQPLII